MSTTTRTHWRLVGRRFIIAFVGGLLFAVLVFFATGFFREEQHAIVLLSAAGILWCICAGVALRRIPPLEVLAVTAGLAWGFLFWLSAAVSIQNGRASVNWKTMTPSLLVIPPAVAITVLPFWYIRRRRGNDGA